MEKKVPCPVPVIRQDGEEEEENREDSDGSSPIPLEATEAWPSEEGDWGPTEAKGDSEIYLFCLEVERKFEAFLLSNLTC